MATWIVEHPDGSASQHVTHGDDLAAEGIDAGSRSTATPRLGTDTETWDWDAGLWVADAARLQASLEQAADRDFLLAQGVEALAMVHARKALEAHDHRARQGQDGTWPLLSAEALATGVPLAQLVAEVLAHDDALIAAEVERRTSKVSARTLNAPL